MASARKRKSDKARGPAGNYTCYWIAENGKEKSKAGTPSYKESLAMAVALEHQAKQVRMGLVDPAERGRAAESRRPIADHLSDYRADLEARGDTEQHVKNTESTIRRLCQGAGIEFIGDITPDRVRGQLARMREPKGKKKGRSARTCNHALTALKGFARWLADTGRIKDYPAGLALVKPYPEEADRRYVRRPLSGDQLAKLLETTEKGADFAVAWETTANGKKPRGKWAKPSRVMTGPDRAMAYLIAMSTGFRAEEIRTLTPDRFALNGPEPTVTVAACYSKRGKRSGRDDVQMIRKDVAARIKPWLDGKPPGEPVLPLAEQKNAEYLRADLEAAGIPYADEKGRVVDFHSLRHSYVTNLIRAGVNPKVVQKLARHSSITLTLDRYTSLEDGEMRAALEGAEGPKGDG